ncbi:hypothetical protein DER45DRAFT_642376 [Fusarium avenaceum]|nr:hypothetical protein DER45DRAFT_642376 [Fusarium avenaceum]
MRSVLYEIAPGGDIEIILKEPDTQEIDPKIVSYRPRPILESDDSSGSEDEEDGNGFYDEFTSMMDDLNMQFYDSSDPSSSDKKDVEIRMRVSSSHLALASPFFKREIETFQEENSSAVPNLVLDGLDSKALAIALNVIHGRQRQVPRKVDLPFLTTVASFAETFGCVEALQFTAEVWHAALYEKEPLNKYCLMWLYSSWVFSWSDSFSEMLRVVSMQYEGPEHFQLNNLPLKNILKKVDRMRIALIKKLISDLGDLKEELSREDGCPDGESKECTALALGCLMRGMRSMAVMRPPVTAPYHGYSLNRMLKVIEGFPQLSASYHETSPDFWETCTVLSRMEPVMRRVTTNMKNLNLSHFRS